MTNEILLKNYFNDMYEKESDAVFRFCYYRVSDRELAIDLVQETFVRFWQSIFKNASSGNSRETTYTRAFIFTIAHNLVIDWYRKKKSVSLEDMIDSTEFTEPSDGNGIIELERAAESRRLVEVLKTLDSTHQQAVYLRYVEGLTPPEIGEVLGISANAASVRVSRGIVELRALTGYDDKDIVKKHGRHYFQYGNRSTHSSART